MELELTLRRVSYGKNSTPLAEREYYLCSGNPVGTPNELIDFYKGKYKRLILMDKNLKEIEQIIKL